jgi:hypothetical protein
MPPRCSQCNQEVSDDTLICPSCGHYVALEKAQQKVEILESAIEGWKKSNATLKESKTNHKAELTRRCRLLDEVTDERDALKKWKEEALAVESTWDIQAVRDVLGIGLGLRIHPEILPAIEKLKEKHRAAEEKAQEMQMAAESYEMLYGEEIEKVRNLKAEMESLRDNNVILSRSQWSDVQNKVASHGQKIMDLREALESVRDGLPPTEHGIRDYINGVLNDHAISGGKEDK